MGMPTGAGYAAGALSQAITDSFKGLNEGEEERRKEEESGRRTRAEITEQAFQPIRFQQGQLQNQQLTQAIEHARAQEGRNVAQEARNVTAEQHAALLRPYELRSTAASTGTNEINFKYAEQKAQADLRQSQAAYDLTSQQLEDARVNFKYLVPKLEADKEAADLALKTARHNWSKLEQKDQLRAEIGVRLMSVIHDPIEFGRVLATVPPGVIGPEDPILVWYRHYSDTIGRGQANEPNLIQKHSAKEGVYSRAVNNAEQAAKAALGSLFGKEAITDATTSGDPKIAEAYNWFLQYHTARRLRAAEQDPILKHYGIGFNPEDKMIEAVPPAIINQMSNLPSEQSQIFNSIAKIIGKDSDLYAGANEANRATHYLEEGLEFTAAVNQARLDRMAAQAGRATPSDYKVVKKDDEGANPYKPVPHKSVLDVPGLPVPESALPPKVEVLPKAKVVDPKLQRMEELVKQHAPELFGWQSLQEDYMQGMPEEQKKVNRQWRQWLEDQYEREQGKK